MQNSNFSPIHGLVPCFTGLLVQIPGNWSNSRRLQAKVWSKFIPKTKYQILSFSDLFLPRSISSSSNTLNLVSTGTFSYRVYYISLLTQTELPTAYRHSTLQETSNSFVAILEGPRVVPVVVLGSVGCAFVIFGWDP